MTNPSSAPDQAEEGRTFLQVRVSRFGLYGFLLGAFFIVVRLEEALRHGHLADEFGPALWLHLLAALSLLAVWLACRSGRPAATYLRWAEGLGLLLACSFYAAMGMFLPLVAHPHYIVLLALAFGVIARSIYVPSSRKRTTLLTCLCGLPLVLATYGMYHDADLEPWRAIEPTLTEVSSHELAVSILVFNLAWWAGVVSICAGASGVIYGLRKEVRGARKLGRYTLEERIGEGSMGMVYRASHAMLRRPTAVKLLPLERAGAQQIARFEREVQLTALLTHPHTVTVFDYGRTPDDVFYYAMEFLDGATLREVVERSGPQPAARVAHILSRVAGALAEAHSVGLTHRDIKPANIMLVEQGGKPDVPKVLDFGLVKDLEQDGEVSVSQTGSVTGTPQYLAPESIRSPEDVDQRADLYALGAVGYFMLTGQHVFTGETVIEMCAKHLQEDPVPPSERLGGPVPAVLEALVLQCLEKDPADRPQTAAEMQAVLQEYELTDAWTEGEAQAWWELHREAIRAGRKTAPVSDMEKALAIDRAPRAP